ncbi:hypothetical protein D3C76_1596720 [compost metagenome]
MRRRQPRLQIQQTIKQAFVVTGLFHQQGHVLFQLIDVLARARHMPFDQRDGVAHWMRHAHLFDDACIADKKLRIAQQIINNSPVVQFHYCFLQFFPWLFHRWINPS